MSPKDRIQQAKLCAAIELLREAGFRVCAPEAARLQVVTAEEAAELLSEDAKLVKEKAKRGLFPGAYLTDAGHFRIPIAGLEAYQRQLAHVFAVSAGFSAPKLEVAA